MLRIVDCFTLDHDQRLLVLAAVVCVVGTVSTLVVAGRAAQHRHPGLWLALLGVCAGTTAWSTHFVAMLAYRTGLAITFDGALTMLSLVAGVVVMGLGFAFAVHGRRHTVARLVGGGVMGGGVAGLHYLGMAAMRLPGELAYEADLVAGSVAVSVGLGALTMEVLYAGRLRRPGIVAGALLCATVLSLHFTAMGAIRLSVVAVDDVASSAGLSREVLAGAVSVASLVLLLIGSAAAMLDQRLSRRLGTAASRFQALAEGAFEALIVHRDGVVTDTNAAARQLFTAGGAAVPGTIDDWFGRTMAFELRRRAPHDPHGTAELEMARADGSRFPVEVRRRSIVLDDESEGELLAIRDLTGRRRSEAQIRHLALHDPLTDLPNRRRFMEVADEALAAPGDDGRGVAVLVMDMDSFKLVNDVYGHAAGDEVMRLAAARIAAVVRDGDVAARLGGDEFAILQVAADQPRAAESLVRRLQDVLCEPMQVGHAELTVTLSTGIAYAPEHGTTTDALLRRADTAMYSAKADGKATWHLYRAEMDTALETRRRFERRLRRAVSDGLFTIFYQPVVDCATRQPLGFEALLRWHDEELGWIPPAECIPVAEETGLIVPIGEFMLRHACRDAVTWPAPLRVAVNLSAVQFRRPGLVDTVRSALMDSGLAGDRLELEVTETLLIENREETMKVLNELRALGVRIAMDDFGTGYSSLSYLQSFPFDKIKIDRAFVSTLQGSTQTACIVRAVKAIGESLGMRVVAEGVESDAQALILDDMACDELQGFLIGRPMPLSEVPGFLSSHPIRTPRPACSDTGSPDAGSSA